MKTFRQLLGILLLVVASAGLVVACGDEAEECLDDSDCAAEDACNFETGQCAFRCTGDGDCLEDEACETRSDDGQGICVSSADDSCTSDDDCPSGELCDFVTEQCAQECTSSDECGEGFACYDRNDTEGNVCAVDEGCTDDNECGENQFCNAEGECEDEAADQDFFINIDDLSTTDQACLDPSDNDPGSDIFGVSLGKDGGQGAEYWGEIVYDEIVDTDGSGNDNEHTDTLILDGTPPGPAGDECPDSFDGNVVALGCGGLITVGFWDSANDDWVPLEAGDQITVFEYGTTCHQNAHTDDEWQVSLCVGNNEDDVITGVCDAETRGNVHSGINSVTL